MFRFDLIKLLALLWAAVLPCILPGQVRTAAAQIKNQKPAESLVEPPVHLNLNIIKEIPEGPAGGQQGIATDGNYIYVQTVKIFKFDMNGGLICQSEPQDLHGGGITYHDKKIYVAMSQCDPSGTKVHKVCVYDAQNLKKTAEYDIGPYFGICAGGIAYYDNHFYVAESYWDDDHYDYIVKFDMDFNFVASYQVDFKCVGGIQGLDYLPSLKVFQVNSHGKEFYRINTNFDSKTLQPGLAPFDLQDVAYLNQNTLLYNDRAGQRIVFSRLEIPAETKLPGGKLIFLHLLWFFLLLQFAALCKRGEQILL